VGAVGAVGAGERRAPVSAGPPRAAPSTA